MQLPRRWPWPGAAAVVAAWLLLLPLQAGAALLRAASSSALRSGEDPATPEEIKAKWDKMDDFLEAMFTIACKWKHGKDVHGAAAAKLKAGEVQGAEGYSNFVKELERQNAQQLTAACGMVVSSGEHKCRQGCADRWNQMLEKRDTCDEQCVAAYDNFEKSCNAKASNLATVYAAGTNKRDGASQCHNGHCPEFPQVWLKEEADMQAEVDTQCTAQCSPDRVEASCARKWSLQADVETANAGSECQEEVQATPCFSGKKDAATTAYDTCKSTAGSTCESDFTKCKTDGQTDSMHKEAQDFCDSRRKMCEEQASEKCLSENKAALEKGKQECASADKEQLETCQGQKLSAKASAFKSQCEGEEMPSCTSKCKQKCDVKGMNECLSNLSDADPTKDFCTDFWRLLHDSSQVDPVSGNPIVLLSPRVPAAVKRSPVP